MKSFAIAATTLVLAGAAYAQAEPETASQADPASMAQQVEDAADAAAAAAEDAADSIGEMASDAVTAVDGAAEDVAAATDEAVEDAAAAADEAAEDTADAADQAADEAAMAAGEAADDAAMAADEAADATAEAASDSAEAVGEAATEAEAEMTEAAPAVTPPDVNPPAISEAEPGVLSSWVTSRRIWTTNQPSTTEWVDPMLEERPAEWQDIAKVNDIVLDDSGQVVGYVADIGGFLGIGAKKVLLGTDAIHLLSIGGDTFFATNYTKQELEALPDFDQKTVRK